MPAKERGAKAKPSHGNLAHMCSFKISLSYPVTLAFILATGTGCGGSSSSPQPTSASASAAAWDGNERSLASLLSPEGGHQSQEQLEAVARFIRRWEQDPFAEMPENDTGTSVPAALNRWGLGSPDVHLAVCPIGINIGEAETDDMKSFVLLAYLMGMAAHSIENPGEQPTSPEVQEVGVRSALTQYEALLRRGGQQSATLDGLRQMRDRGELLQWVAANAGC